MMLTALEQGRDEVLGLGLKVVSTEMLEKVLAYNISQIIRMRKKLSERQETERTSA